LLQRLSPRGPDALVKGRIQAAMGRELARPAGLMWERRYGRLAAAAVLLGLALNYAAIRADNARQARYGPPASPEVQDVARMVETVSDRETGQWVTQQFQRAQRPLSHSGVPAFENNLHYIWQEIEHAPTDKNAEVPGPNRPRPAGAGVDCKRLFGLADRQTPGGTAEQAARGRGAVVAG